MEMENGPRQFKRAKHSHAEPIVILRVGTATGSVSMSMSTALLYNTTPWPLQPNLSSSAAQLLSDDLNVTNCDLIPPVSQPVRLDKRSSPSVEPFELSSPQTLHSGHPPNLPPAHTTIISDSPTQPRGSFSNQPPRTFISPFTDSEDRLIKITVPRYARPENGQVNGYVKFNWPSGRSSIGPSNSYSNGVVKEIHSDSSQPLTMGCSPIATLINMSPKSMTSLTNEGTMFPLSLELSSSLVPSRPMMSISPISVPESSMQLVPSSYQPQMLPPHFGYQAKMLDMGRRIWDFYIKNWCPGRSVLANTNLWLKDFAQMQQNDGVRAAIQSLAGVYIYDYLPDEGLRRYINDQYVRANRHFSNLLAAPSSFEVGKGNEVVTMAVILSMQDIVLTERRLKKPHQPRWLEGFKQGEQILQLTDPGSRFWKDTNIQLDSLRISHSIIVGRAVILAQPMMELPAPETLVPDEEASRFGWLLYGTERDMYEIHGGCGFSKKLLHIISQVTYCAARLQQEPESSIVPITAKYLLCELIEMRQWSSEGIDWAKAQERPQPISWVQTKPDDFQIDTDQDMTDVTAEAWRIAAIIYLQRRISRLPRRHPDVLANMADLARCISIMPTSGSHFTAQAPLLPVFLLGLFSTVPKHRDISRAWFDAVVKTPVRSSVPPLYEALKRIWTWIDPVVETASMDMTAVPKSISMRSPWWESLVANVHEKEEETLCVT